VYEIGKYLPRSVVAGIFNEQGGRGIFAMAATELKTYRVSPEVDTEIKKLAKRYGGVDKALKILLASIPFGEIKQPEGEYSPKIEAQVQNLVKPQKLSKSVTPRVDDESVHYDE
jgi:hypothetical protein